MRSVWGGTTNALLGVFDVKLSLALMPIGSKHQQMNAPTDDTSEATAAEKRSSCMMTVVWGVAVFPAMIATGTIFGAMFKDTAIPSYWFYFPLISVCGLCGFFAGRNWKRAQEALVSSLPVACGIGLAIWLLCGIAATLGPTPNAKWAGVPEGVSFGAVFLIASGAGAALRRNPAP